MSNISCTLVNFNDNDNFINNMQQACINWSRSLQDKRQYVKDITIQYEIEAVLEGLNMYVKQAPTDKTHLKTGMNVLQISNCQTAFQDSRSACYPWRIRICDPPSAVKSFKRPSGRTLLLHMQRCTCKDPAQRFLCYFRVKWHHGSRLVSVTSYRKSDSVNRCIFSLLEEQSCQIS